MEKGTLSLDNGSAKVENVLCVEDLKNNILSVVYMCDQRNTLTFNSQECKIIRENASKLVAREIKAPNNVYIFYEISGENCFMGQTYESCFWYTRMGHMNFDNLVKINTKQGVMDIPKITKYSNIVCK